VMNTKIADSFALATTFKAAMNLQILVSNLTNPTLLFFLLGIIAVRVKSDLEIPASTAKFISLYLLFLLDLRVDKN